jgi:hypothetical protein
LNCHEFSRQLSGAAEHSPALMSHAFSCARCRALLAFDRQLRGSHLQKPLAMSAELRAAVALEAGARARFSVLRRAVAPIGSLLALAAAVQLLAPRPDAGGVPFPTAAIVSVVLLGAFLAALVLLLARARLGAGGFAVARYAFPPLALIVFLGVSWLAYETIPSSTYPPRAIQVFLSRDVEPLVGSWVRHLPCSLLGLAAGLLLMSLVLRSAASIAITTPRASGAVCGAAAGLAAAFVLFLFCPVHLLQHLAGVHAIPLLVCSALGFKAGVR